MKAFSITALCVSVFALAMSVWIYLQADARAEQAMQRREKALVERYKPAMEQLCEEFKLKNRLQDAQTLEELLEPLLRLLASLDR